MAAPQAMLCLALALMAAGESAEDALRAVAGRVAATAGRQFGAPPALADLDPARIQGAAGAVFDAVLAGERAGAFRAGLAAFRFARPDAAAGVRPTEWLGAAFDRARDPGDLAGQIQATRALAFASIAEQIDVRAFLAAAADADRRLARLAVVVGLAVDLADRTLVGEADAIAAATAARPVLDASAWDPFAALARPERSAWEVGVWSFAMIDGAAFVRAVRDRDPGALERLLVEPPESTEQVVDPLRWLEPSDAPVDVAVSDLAPLLADGAKVVADDVLGVAQLELFLASEGEPVRATRAVAGWRGDRFRVYRTASGDLLAWVGRFDDDDAAGRAEEAIAKVFLRRFHAAHGRRPDWPEDPERVRTARVEPDGAVLEVVARRGVRVAYLSGPGAARAELMDELLAR